MTSISDQAPVRDEVARDRLRSVGVFFDAASFAVIGASDRRGVHIAATDNLGGHGAPAWGVHPTRSEVRGLPCFASVEELPAVPDVAVLLVGHGALLEATDAALKAGVRGLVIPGLGHEAGPLRSGISVELAGLAERYGSAILGPNCMGIALPGAASPWVGTLGPEVRAGNVAAVVQSGSVGEALAALGPRVGFRCIASVGAELNRDVADFCAELAVDADTHAVGLFLETVRRPRALRRALHMLADAGKPVVCLRAGRSEAGSRATIAHTDGLLTPGLAFSALAADAGLIEIADFAEFVEALELVGHERRPQGTKIAAITQSGGEAALLGDLAEDAGAPLPEFSPGLADQLADVLPRGLPITNPLDAWAIDETPGTYARAFEAVLRSGEFDLLLIQWDQSPFVGEMERRIAEAVLGELASLDAGRVLPVIVSGQTSEPLDKVRELAQASGIPLLRGAGAAVRALVAVARWDPRRPQGPPSAGSEITLSADLLEEAAASDLLEGLGIRFASRELARDLDQAQEAAQRLGFPLILKAQGHPHRARKGLVVGDIADERQLQGAFERLAAPALLAEQIPVAPEVYCGGRVDADYGPLVCCGWGGTAVESMRCAGCRIAPFEVSEARKLVDSVPHIAEVVDAQLLDQLASMLVSLGDAIARMPVGTSVDLNPVLLSRSHGVVAVDALIARGFETGKRN